MIKVAIIGFGSRGRMFGRLIHQDEMVELVAVAEPVKAGREAGRELGVREDMLFESAEDFFAQGKICDAVFICTQDMQGNLFQWILMSLLLNCAMVKASCIVC